MDVRPINVDWAAGAFPAVFAVYGASPLRRQIEAFNAVVSATRYAHDDIEFAFASTARECRNIHRPILNTLSLFPDPDWSPQGKAMLLLLESYLRASLDAGDSQSTYRDMLLNPQSYMDLIAELDWASRLRRQGGVFHPHAKTNPDVPGDNTNYDLHWESPSGPEFHGDVKVFKDWLIKPRGEDLLRGQIWLIQPDLAHHIVVSTRMTHWTQDKIISAAMTVLELYHAALDRRQDPRWVIEGPHDRPTITLRAAAYTFPPPPDLFVERVTILATAGKRGSASVVESGCGGADDVDAARRNIAGAAIQIPRKTKAGDVSCACIGSAIPQDADDVEAALFGQKDGQNVGLFLSDEPGCEHLNAVIHFSLRFEPAADDPRVVVMQRDAVVFQGPAPMTAEQEEFLKATVNSVQGESEVTIA